MSDDVLRGDIEDRDVGSISGYAALTFVVLGSAVLFVLYLWSGVFLALPGATLVVFMAKGLYVVEPNESRVFRLFGSYRGTDLESGLRWVNPFFSGHKVSRRIHSVETAVLKVNDAAGNPVEIGATVIWRVADAAKVSLQIGDFESFVGVQAVSAVRHLASSYPYDDVDRRSVESAPGQGNLTLLGGGKDIVDALLGELEDRLGSRGIEVLEARIAHLAYAPEIAPAMLRRQQAEAIVSARKTIVDGAVDIVEDALQRLEARKIQVSEERRSELVSSLLVVLVSERDAAPVIQVG